MSLMKTEWSDRIRTRPWPSSPPAMNGSGPDRCRGFAARRSCSGCSSRRWAGWWRWCPRGERSDGWAPLGVHQRTLGHALRSSASLCKKPPPTCTPNWEESGSRIGWSLATSRAPPSWTNFSRPPVRRCKVEQSLRIAQHDDDRVRRLDLAVVVDRFQLEFLGVAGDRLGDDDAAQARACPGRTASALPARRRSPAQQRKVITSNDRGSPMQIPSTVVPIGWSARRRSARARCTGPCEHVQAARPTAARRPGRSGPASYRPARRSAGSLPSRRATSRWFQHWAGRPKLQERQVLEGLDQLGGDWRRPRAAPARGRAARPRHPPGPQPRHGHLPDGPDQPGQSPATQARTGQNAAASPTIAHPRHARCRRRHPGSAVASRCRSGQVDRLQTVARLPGPARPRHRADLLQPFAAAVGSRPSPSSRSMRCKAGESSTCSARPSRCSLSQRMISSASWSAALLRRSAAARPVRVAGRSHAAASADRWLLRLRVAHRRRQVGRADRETAAAAFPRCSGVRPFLQQVGMLRQLRQLLAEFRVVPVDVAILQTAEELVAGLLRDRAFPGSGPVVDGHGPAKALLEDLFQVGLAGPASGSARATSGDRPAPAPGCGHASQPATMSTPAARAA